MKKFLIALAMAATTLGGIGVAEAQHYDRRGYSHYNHRYDYRPYRYDDRGYDRRNYRSQVWQDRNGRYRCRRSDGTTGTVIGAIAGALLGRTVDSHGDRTLGTVIGGGAGALAGRSIDRGSCR